MVKKPNFHTSSTINFEEVDQFDKIANSWWDETGPFKPLHQMNPCRLKFIKEHLLHNFSNKNISSLKGLRVLDIGCGGGLLCEPLARLEAVVTGIDASPAAILTAQNHAKESDLTIDYHCTTIEEFPSDKFDAILALEIVEHIDNLSVFIENCAKLLKPEGLLFLSTLNQTWESYLGAIVGAEYLLRWLPVGTHDWNKFKEPSKLANLLRKFGLHFTNLKGMSYSPLEQEWSLTSSLKINYIACANFI
jgi:2-polyprenyl-6-hydroxyphenyl methylase/3-demethylubiquinone-9 3-methyltransferase